jgi:cell division protein FtsL
MRIDSPFIDLYKSKNFFLITLLGLVTVFCAIINIYSKHKIRTLHVQLKKINLEYSNQKMERSRLLLEKSTLTTDSRVEGIARNKFGMVSPEEIYIINNK